MRITKIIGVILTGIILISGACSPAPRITATAQVKVLYNSDEETWTPSITFVSVGGVVTWLNDGFNLHAVISEEGLFDQTLSPGQSFNYTLSKPGTYTYHDDRNTEFLGKVVVE